MAVELRDYQQRVIDDTRAALRRSQSALIVVPTGGGKTVLSAFMAGSASNKGLPVAFVVHRRELVTQTAETFAKVGIPFGIVASGFTMDRRAPVQICSLGTMARRLDLLPKFGLMLWDEAHHVAAKSWSDVMANYPKARHVGLSATPERLDGSGLGKWFGEMVMGPRVAWLIEQGHLSPYRMFAPTTPDLQGVKTSMGDFSRNDLEGAMSKPKLVGDVVNHYRQLAHGRRAMAFCVSIKHSLAVVAQFQAAGYRAAHIDGDSADRDTLIERFKRGDIQVLSSVDLVSEGFDLPAIEAAILLRPTKSVGLYLQQVGRCLRTAPGKTEAIILDHAGNSATHGLPDDDREWSLEGRKKRKKAAKDGDEEPAVAIRQCPVCYTVHRPAPTCPKCDHVYPTMGRTVEQVEGELAEIERARAQRDRKVEQAKAQTLEDLINIGRMRGYKNPKFWAEKVFEGRMRKGAA